MDSLRTISTLSRAYILLRRMEADRPLMTPRKRRSPCWLAVKVRAPDTDLGIHIQCDVYIVCGVLFAFPVYLLLTWLCPIEEVLNSAVVAYKVDRPSDYLISPDGREGRRPREVDERTMVVCLIMWRVGETERRHHSYTWGQSARCHPGQSSRTQARKTEVGTLTDG